MASTSNRDPEDAMRSIGGEIKVYFAVIVRTRSNAPKNGDGRQKRYL
jgi:hypothetical protein